MASRNLIDASWFPRARPQWSTRSRVFDRSIDVQVLRLRRKLEADPRARRIIQTERGVGYVLRRASALDAFFIGRSGGSRNNRLWPQFLAVDALNARRQGSGPGAGGFGS
jgi:hypothetical protein